MFLLTDRRNYNPAPIRPDTKAQSGSDPEKKVKIRLRSGLVSGSMLISAT